MRRHDLGGEIALQRQHPLPELELGLAEPARRILLPHALSVDQRHDVGHPFRATRLPCGCSCRLRRGVLGQHGGLHAAPNTRPSTEIPVDPAGRIRSTPSTLRLDKYEVTVGRFRQFVAAGMGTQSSPPSSGAGAHPNIVASGWDASWNGSLTANEAALVAAVKCAANYQTWTDTAGANESLPMNCITWFEAMAFCAWDGGFMPTEAEWNYASAGGNEQRAHPWSSPPAFLGIDCSYANYNPGTHCVNPPTGAVNRVGSESPKGDGKWGQSDLAGNVFEWTLDWYANPYPQNPCPDCANLTPAAARVVRGGYYADADTALRVGYRSLAGATSRDNHTGLRCARTP
ncbi:MAG: SUMF1/EgtB/PvdO family nonheme iron enzyme [Proteobacteria bacterium]|nr:SUMF1/EgtB/PvdO family nonheme iron enzyme [Pseudomonadota bacterium]